MAPVPEQLSGVVIANAGKDRKTKPDAIGCTPRRNRKADLRPTDNYSGLDAVAVSMTGEDIATTSTGSDWQNACSHACRLHGTQSLVWRSGQSAHRWSYRQNVGIAWRYSLALAGLIAHCSGFRETHSRGRSPVTSLETDLGRCLPLIPAAPAARPILARTASVH